MTRRIKVVLKCGHTRLLGPNSAEAEYAAEHGTVQCLSFKYAGEYVHEPLENATWNSLHIRVFGESVTECEVGERDSGHDHRGLMLR